MAKPDVKVTIAGDASSLEREAAKARQALGDVEGKSKSSSSVVGAFAKGFVTTAAVSELAKFGAGAIAASNQMAALDAKSKTVFEDSLSDVKDWADRSAQAMGMTTRELVGATAATADLLKPMGFTTQAAAEMSIKLGDLSGALSAWSGGQRTAAEVSTIVQKALLGERDGLKELGVSISEADVQTRLAQKGQQNLKGAVLEQAKAQATLELVLEKSTDAQKAWNDGSMDGIKNSNQAKVAYKALYDGITKGVGDAANAFIEWTGILENFDRSNIGVAELEYTRAIGMADLEQLRTMRIKDRTEAEQVLTAKLADKQAAEEAATKAGEEMAKVTALITKREEELFDATQKLWGKEQIDIPAAVDEVNASLLDYYEAEKKAVEVNKDHTSSTEESQRAMIDQRDASRDLQGSMQDYAEDVLAAAEAQAELEGKTLTSTEKTGILRAALEELALKFPPLQGAVDNMVNAYGSIAAAAEDSADRQVAAFAGMADKMAEIFGRYNNMIVATADQMARQADRIAAAATVTPDALAAATRVNGSEAMQRAIGINTRVT